MYHGFRKPSLTMTFYNKFTSLWSHYLFFKGQSLLSCAVLMVLFFFVFSSQYLIIGCLVHIFLFPIQFSADLLYLKLKTKKKCIFSFQRSYLKPKFFLHKENVVVYKARKIIKSNQIIIVNYQINYILLYFQL